MCKMQDCNSKIISHNSKWKVQSFLKQLSEVIVLSASYRLFSENSMEIKWRYSRRQKNTLTLAITCNCSQIQQELTFAHEFYGNSHILWISQILCHEIGSAHCNERSFWENFTLHVCCSNWIIFWRFAINRKLWWNRTNFYGLNYELWHKFLHSFHKTICNYNEKNTFFTSHWHTHYT